MESNIKLSGLGHLWILDLDGTLVKHNGYLNDGFDSLLPGAREFIEAIPANDMVMIVTSRKKEYQLCTEDFLLRNGIRFDYMIYDIPFGERILVNDRKRSGLKTAVAVNVERDSGDLPEIKIDEKL